MTQHTDQTAYTRYRDAVMTIVSGSKIGFDGENAPVVIRNFYEAGLSAARCAEDLIWEVLQPLAESSF